MKLEGWHKIIRVILIIIPIIFLSFLFYKDLVVSGKLSASYDFKNESSFILPLGPRDRITEVKNDGDYIFQGLLGDPVYFDVRLPRQFQKITFWVTYWADEKETFKIGSFINKDLWTFEVKDFSSIQSLDNGWKRGEVTFDLASKRYDQYKYQFMFSLPDIKNSGGEVSVAKIEIIAERAPLTWDKLISKIKERL